MVIVRNGKRSSANTIKFIRSEVMYGLVVVVFFIVVLVIFAEFINWMFK